MAAIFSCRIMSHQLALAGSIRECFKCAMWLTLDWLVNDYSILELLARDRDSLFCPHNHPMLVLIKQSVRLRNRKWCHCYANWCSSRGPVCATRILSEICGMVSLQLSKLGYFERSHTTILTAHHLYVTNMAEVLRWGSHVCVFMFSYSVVIRSKFVQYFVLWTSTCKTNQLSRPNYLSLKIPSFYYTHTI